MSRKKLIEHKFNSSFREKGKISTEIPRHMQRLNRYSKRFRRKHHAHSELKYGLIDWWLLNVQWQMSLLCTFRMSLNFNIDSVGNVKLTIWKSTERHISRAKHIHMTPNRPVFALSSNATSLAEKQHVPILECFKQTFDRTN